MGTIYPSGDINTALSEHYYGGPSNALVGWNEERGAIKMKLDQYYGGSAVPLSYLHGYKVLERPKCISAQVKKAEWYLYAYRQHVADNVRVI
jgi:hypothetical protein